MSSSHDSIIRRAFSDPLAFDELNEFLVDHSRYRKSVMRVWLSKDIIDDLRSLVPNLPPGLALARDAIMSLLEEVPVCQSADPETTIERLKNYLQMRTPAETPKVRKLTIAPPAPQMAPQLSAEQIAALLQLLNQRPQNQEGE